MLVYPEYLLSHIDEAMKKSDLLDKDLTIEPFDRDHCDIDIQRLEMAKFDAEMIGAYSNRNGLE